MVLLLAKQIITLYHAVQKTLTKDQHALISSSTKKSVTVFTTNTEAATKNAVSNINRSFSIGLEPENMKFLSY
ncbi:hypothetical protein BIT28_24030 [Photobacterium proteolyticum]|uniref:Uncharacterized protein n=1 Tax=Photobacterium proteolyticum TaxID=1903952 RepID=A0A1Q9GBT5_9GAMM|nr:hypothetical protein BIT28_24030 [Photobacterium proteolyticum]